MEDLNQKNKNLIILLICSMIVFCSFAVSAADLSLKISANLNGYSADFYAVTDSNANTTYDGYDMGSQPLQTNDSRLFSWCAPGISSPNPSNATCSIVIDSWPAETRTFYLVYRFNPNTNGVLNLTWNSSAFGSDYSALLTDYGTNSTYSSGANVSSPLNMKTNDSYSASFSNWRYLTMGITYTPPEEEEGGGGGAGAGLIAEECIPVWTCSEWSGCLNNMQARTCADAKNCSGSESYNETQYCRCSKDSECNYDNDCADDYCDEESGKCGQINLKVGDYCDDNLYCTLNEQCDGTGNCVPRGDRECPAGLMCGEQTDACVEGEPLPIEEVPLDVLSTCKSDCSPSYICGDFRRCEGEYNINQLISGDNINGVKSQECTDKNDCCDDFSNTENCNLKQEVDVRAMTWCGENYTELVDSAGKVVARMKETSGGESVSVDLNAVGNGYCSYCYNAVKDGDEEGIDCGGSCDKCGIVFKEYYAPLYNMAQLIAALGFFLFFIVTFIFIFADLALYLKNIFLLRRLGGKYAYWQKEGYDVDVLEKDLSRMEKAYEYKVHKI